MTLGQANYINSLGQVVGQANSGHSYLATPTGTLNWFGGGADNHWDNPANWELGFVPNNLLDTVIVPPSGSDVVVNGPTGAPVTVNSLVIGGASGASGGTATLNLNSQPLTVINGATLLPGGTLLLGGGEKLGNTSALIVAGGTFDLGGNSNTVAAVTLQSGTIQNGTLTSTSDYILESGTVTANLAGAVNLGKSGPAGTVYLGGANTYTGFTHIQEGKLVLLADQALPSTTTVVFGQGINEALDLNGHSQAIAGLADLGNPSTIILANPTDHGPVAGLFSIGSGSYSGNITGFGRLEKVGNGTLSLVGINDYSEGTTVSGGVLQGNSASLQGNIVNNASVVFVQSSPGTYAGVMSGTGGMTLQAGALALTGANTYTGMTTISGGTLALAGVGGIANSSGVVVESHGTLDIAETTAGASIQTLSGGGTVNLGAQTLTLTNAADTFAGGIEGKGGLILASGKETLGGTNAFTGQTTVKPGASLILTGSAGLAGGLGNQGTVDINGPGATHVIGGDVVNDGRFKITDTSVRYDGEFINNGAYISDPSTNQFTDLSVGANGYLVGGPDDKFIVTGNFNNASAQNTLWDTSQSNLVFSSPTTNANANTGTSTSPPGQHIMELAGVDKGPTAKAADKNFAWGSVTLNSGNSLKLADGNSTPGAALYTRRLILPGGVGELSSISSNYNVYYDPTLEDNKYLLGSKNFGSGVGQLLPWDFEPFDLAAVDKGLTPNQLDFAAALNQACTAPRGVLITRCLQLQGLSLPQQKQAIASLTPDQIQGQVASPILFGATRMDAATSTRLAAFHSGGGTGPLSFNFNGVQIPMGRLARVLGLNAKGGAAGADGEPFRDSPLGVYVQARFDFGDLRNTTWARGFNSQSRAVTVGADYRLTDQLVSGLAFNYTNTVADYVNSAGRMESDTYMGSFYGSYFLPKDFYVDWLASYGGTDYSYNRRFSYPGFNGQTRSKPVGEQFGFAVTGGKEFSWQGWTFNPFLRWEYLNLHVGAYQEKGGQGFDTTTGGQTNHSFTSNLGVQVSHAVSVPWGVLVPSLRVDWEHQYLNDNRAVQMRLSDAAPGLGNFTIRTGPPDRDYVNLGGSVSATLPNGGAGFVRYQTRLGQAAITDHIVEAGVRISF